MKKGTKVTYHGTATADQIRWGEGADPRKYLVYNEVYTIEEIIREDWNTAICLKEIPGKKFNYIFFKDLAGKSLLKDV